MIRHPAFYLTDEFFILAIRGPGHLNDERPPGAAGGWRGGRRAGGGPRRAAGGTGATLTATGELSIARGLLKSYSFLF